MLGGLAIGFLPGGPSELAPEVVFLVFLPPMLQSAGYYASPGASRGGVGRSPALVLGLFLTTIVVVAAVAQALIPDLGWGEALVLGAIVAPTDPVAAIATFGRVRDLGRLLLLVEGRRWSTTPSPSSLTGWRLAAVVTGSFAAGTP